MSLRVLIGRAKALPARRVDATLAALLLVAAIAELQWTPLPPGWDQPSVWSYVASVTMTVPLAWRRTIPTVVMSTVGNTAILAIVFTVVIGFSAQFGIMLALYSIAAYGIEKDAYFSGGVTAVAIAWSSITSWDDGGLSGATSGVMLFGAAWLVGWAMRNRRLLLEEMQARVEQAEATRTTEAARAVAEERTRISRELHDVVAHAVSVMVVQAGAARRIVGSDPQRASGAITAIEQTGREALAELRRLMGVLRQNGGSSRRPQPTLDALGGLVDGVRDAGVNIELQQDSVPEGLPPGVELSAFRVVQEALTNVLKHAGPTRRISVSVRVEDDALLVEVEDDGQGASAAASVTEGGGHGLIGMRERVALYGGELRAGPRRGGGYRVAARFPLADTSRSEGRGDLERESNPDPVQTTVAVSTTPSPSPEPAQ